jgi:hypothetical protein
MQDEDIMTMHEEVMSIRKDVMRILVTQGDVMGTLCLYTPELARGHYVCTRLKRRRAMNNMTMVILHESSLVSNQYGASLCKVLNNPVINNNSLLGTIQ